MQLEYKMIKPQRLKYTYDALLNYKKAKIIELFVCSKDNQTTLIATKINEPISRVNGVIDQYIKAMRNHNQPAVADDKFLILKSKMNTKNNL